MLRHLFIFKAILNEAQMSCNKISLILLICDLEESIDLQVG